MSVMDKMTKVPVEEATTPFDGAMVMTDRYWAVLDGCLLFYKGHAPQCNSQKSLAEYLSKKLYPEAEIKFIPTVYVKHRCEP